MISPVVVDCRRSGLVAAMCHNAACGGWNSPTHLLYAGLDIRAAEKAADEHLKAIQGARRRRAS